MVSVIGIGWNVHCIPAIYSFIVPIRDLSYKLCHLNPLVRPISSTVRGSIKSLTFAKWHTLDREHSAIFHTSAL